jgi:hypothetical protein
MKRMSIRLFLVGTAAALVVFLNVGEADAQTCSSVCNQIRRACNSEVKAAKKVAMAVCEENRGTCRTACEIDPDSCFVDCETENAACLAACAEDPDCEAACAAALAECPDDCLPCCNYRRASCRGEAKAIRQEARLTCEASRQTCQDECVDPINGACVRGCKAVQKSCRKDAKKNYWTLCKRNCDEGTDRRACMSRCRKQVNEEYGDCSTAEVGCLVSCIGAAP